MNWLERTGRTDQQPFLPTDPLLRAKAICCSVKRFPFIANSSLKELFARKAPIKLGQVPGGRPPWPAPLKPVRF